ncbi:hypothetical protein LTR62_007473 [Meristemomyces frigidus]|uniref:Zn(2)-C6 fungal-type domain-containing protein n=1 Tax=Meristemomyces frigidus TaxID=1508187 RepID=A0AAN7TMA8_9PEZI|nr:hypothetical protein LTR62_007473 [Meristemomyces frigidus]
MNGIPRQQDSAPLQSFTCVTCAKRKVKCDKTGPPCTTCKKTRLECHYEAPPPRKRKRKVVEDVYERLEQYESILKQNGLLDELEKASPLVESGGDRPAKPNIHRSEDKSELKAGGLVGVKFGTLVANHGNTYPTSSNASKKSIDSTLWRNLNDEELAPSSDEEEATEEDQSTSAAFAYRTADPLSASLLSGGSPAASLLDIHPTYDAAMKLWKVFQSHVEPLTKILHVPSVTALVKRAAANPSSASKSTECLLFVIYHFAVVVMESKECEDLMGFPQNLLQKQYHGAAVQGLVNAGFIRTTDFVVVQAFVLFLLSVRNKYDPHTFWILTGIATRLGQRIGLHRDPERLGLGPFEVQMRRRLFWQLLPLDGIASQMSGTGIAMAYDTWDTEQPLNVNDADIWPDMIETPKERSEATDMMFCMMRTEMGKFHQKVKPYLGSWGRLWEGGDHQMIEEIDKAIGELEAAMESKYLRYADPVYSLHLLALLLGRGAPQNARLRLRLPRIRLDPDASPNERDQIWKLCLKMFDYDQSAHTNPALKKYSWHLQAIFQWDTVIWVLNELRRGSPSITEPEEVWSRIEWMFESHPRFKAGERALHAAIKKLALKAWDGQPERCRPREGGDPAFIQSLRVSCQKRASASVASEVPQAKPNIWSPANDYGGVAWSGVAPPYSAQVGNGAATAMQMSFLEEFSPDNIDWMFWDQLIQDNGTLPPVMDFGGQG